MRKKYIQKLLIFLFLFFPTSVFAVTFVSDTYTVDINANITTDLFSQVGLSSVTAEIYQPVNINVYVKDGSGNPLSGHTIVLYQNGALPGLVLTQPSSPTNSSGLASTQIYSTQPGVFEICAKDTTYGFDILISDCVTFFVIPVPIPTMTAEPYYTQGTSNTVSWSDPSTATHEYYVEVSTSNTFNVVFKNSGWVSDTSYTFGGLGDGQMYFYRVKARNAYTGESSWSNIVYSVQDESAPEISLIDISDIGENTQTDWESAYEISFKFLVKDNLKIKDVSFFCVWSDGTKKDCSSSESLVGTDYVVKIILNDLYKKNIINLFPEYFFCVVAEDQAGNVTEKCDFKLEIPETYTEPVEPDKPKPPIITPPKIVEKIIENISLIVDKNITQEELDTVVVTSTAVTTTVGLVSLLTGLTQLPSIILSFIFWLLGILGIRRRGKPIGYIYDSKTKEPIPQAIVRIMSDKNGLEWTDVTNGEGYFRVKDLEDGSYNINVRAKDYRFPSEIVFGKEDFPLTNIYHGEYFDVKDGVFPPFSIPLDSEKVKNLELRVEQLKTMLKILWRVIYTILFVLGFLFTLYAAYRYPKIINLIILSLYIPSFFLYINSFRKRDRYGIVKDEEGNVIVDLGIVLKDQEFEKVVAKRVTDEKGRYRFLIEPGKYMYDVLNPNYRIISINKKSDLNIDFSKKKNLTMLSFDIVVGKIESDEKTA